MKKKAANGIMIYFLSLIIILDCSVLKLSAKGSSAEMKIIHEEENLMIDHNYLFALHSLDMFLHAWVTRNFNEGPQYVTEALKNSEQDNLKMFFCGISNPHHQAYEVIGSKYIDKDTIRFKVWLYEHVTGQTIEQEKRPKPCYIHVVKVDSEQWLVNTLPIFLKTK